MKRCARRGRARALRQLIRRALGPLTGRLVFPSLKMTLFVFAPDAT